MSTAGGARAEPELRLARAYLLRVAEPPAPRLAALVSTHGAVEAAERVRRGEVPAAVAGETAARRETCVPERDLADAERIGARLVVPEDEEWPAWPLLSLEVAAGRGIREAGTPLGLWVRGSARLDEATGRALAVVGARASTAYGEHLAAELAHGLAGRDVTVFSGAAYGIDGAAHRGALAAPGRTVAVLGCGLDAGYPAGHVALLGRIAEEGAVISEYPPGAPPARHRFLIRNRLLAALTSGTLVVEAGRRSGARNTATTAGTLGKMVMAVPGPVGSAMSAGCHDMIRSSDATLVTSVAEVLDAAGPIGAPAESGNGNGHTRTTDGLTGQALRVHEALGLRAGRSVEHVVAESGVPAHRVRALLPALELDGLVERCDSGWRRARAAR
ncbi:DNA-protecting protein DprA [Amycolatopsis antarctica]|uniref:DNA-protecting protein DprA n=1 Tax=Amycolatopsis antarctica TaxID=1854586 RepID=A0A263D6Y1_9PSEU|nr:DNA-processing protein DprA [Amycolatopsis antarctica]OZM74131.1 DNA-protecting protein DprA [Amycolatopsis antarctica]